MQQSPQDWSNNPGSDLIISAWDDEPIIQQCPVVDATQKENVQEPLDSPIQDQQNSFKPPQTISDEVEREEVQHEKKAEEIHDCPSSPHFPQPTQVQTIEIPESPQSSEKSSPSIRCMQMEEIKQDSVEPKPTQDTETISEAVAFPTLDPTIPQETLNKEENDEMSLEEATNRSDDQIIKWEDWKRRQYQRPNYYNKNQHQPWRGTSQHNMRQQQQMQSNYQPQYNTYQNYKKQKNLRQTQRIDGGVIVGQKRAYNNRELSQRDTRNEDTRYNSRNRNYTQHDPNKRSVSKGNYDRDDYRNNNTSYPYNSSSRQQQLPFSSREQPLYCIKCRINGHDLRGCKSNNSGVQFSQHTSAVYKQPRSYSNDSAYSSNSNANYQSRSTISEQRDYSDRRQTQDQIFKRDEKCVSSQITNYSSQESISQYHYATRMCYKCRREGHISRDCPVYGDAGYFHNFERMVYHPQKFPNQLGLPMPYGSSICYRCNETGHFARECPNDYDRYGNLCGPRPQDLKRSYLEEMFKGKYEVEKQQQRESYLPCKTPSRIFTPSARKSRSHSNSTERYTGGWAASFKGYQVQSQPNQTLRKSEIGDSSNSSSRPSSYLQSQHMQKDQYRNDYYQESYGAKRGGYRGQSSSRRGNEDDKKEWWSKSHSPSKSGIAANK